MTVKDKILSILDTAEGLASGSGFEYAEIRLSRSVSNTITLSGADVDAFSSGDRFGGSVRILKNGAWGFVTFNEPQMLEGCFEKCLDICVLINSGVKRGVYRLKPEKVEKIIIPEKDFGTISAAEKFELISSYNKILRSPDSVSSTGATYYDRRTFSLFINSEGTVKSFEYPYCGISLSAVAGDGSKIQPYHSSISSYAGYETLEGKEELAETVVKTALDLLKAGSLPGGTYDIVADQKLAGVFVHEALGHLSEADFVSENKAMREVMKPGREFGPGFLNVTDDGSLEGLSGYIPFDDEGTAPSATAIIKNGALAGLLHSRETALEMGAQPTGNARAIGTASQPIVRMTNTYIENGPHSSEELMSGADGGIYAAGFIGGQTNLEMFTFSPACGYEIKNGKKGRMYRDIVLSGNIFSTLKNISMIANDRLMFGGLGGCGKKGQSPLPVSFGGPHILVKGVVTGGTGSR